MKLVHYSKFVVQILRCRIVVDPSFKRADLAHQLLGSLGIVPKAVLLGDVLFLGYLGFLTVDVKDTSLAHRASLTGS